jgi:branched-chain amino acid transport system permease protein
MNTLIQALVFGVLVGGVYALASSGLALIFGVMRIVNLAHGGLLMGAAFLTYTLCTATGLDPFAAIPAICAAMFVVGWVIYRFVVRRAERGGEAALILSTLALAMVLEGLIILVWGSDRRIVPAGYTNSSFHLGALALPKAQFYGFLTAVVVLAALQLVLTRTWLGRAVRAAAANPTGAELVGIRVANVKVATYALGAAVTGAAGAIFAVIAPFTPDSGDRWIGLGLAIVVLGGMGSLAGALVGALLLGAAETLTTTYVSTSWATAVPYLVIVLVLLLRPQGLFGTQTREDVIGA